jgi:hypothetical protein
LIYKVFAICIIDVVISKRNNQFSESDDEDKEPAIKSLNYRLKKNSVKATKYWDIKNYFCIVIVSCHGPGKNFAYRLFQERRK